MPRHIKLNLWEIKTKKKLLKVAREKQHPVYKGKSTWMIADFSSETIEALLLSAERKMSAQNPISSRIPLVMKGIHNVRKQREIVASILTLK